MEKLDALDWVSEDSYDILDHRVVVRSTSAQFTAEARRLLRSFRPAPSDRSPSDLILSFVVAPTPISPIIRPFHLVYRGDAQVARTTNYWQLFRTLELQLSSFLGDTVENYFLLHAGAVTKGGAGIIFPGPSGSGKSSLTTALLFQGYRYLSDEMVPVNPITIQADCFPKALSIKDRSVFPLLHLAEHCWIGPETSDNGAVWYLHPEDLASQAISDPVHISHIIFPTYKSDGKAKLEPLPANQAATKLIENSINFSKFGRDGLGLVADLVKGAQCYSLTMNGIGPTTELIDELVTKTV